MLNGTFVILNLFQDLNGRKSNEKDADHEVATRPLKLIFTLVKQVQHDVAARLNA